jgi:hypothetical protein
MNLLNPWLAGVVPAPRTGGKEQGWFHKNIL